jgi:hypothetical protein
MDIDRLHVCGFFFVFLIIVLINKSFVLCLFCVLHLLLVLVSGHSTESSCSVVLMGLSGPRSRPTYSQKIWQYLWVCSQE